MSAILARQLRQWGREVSALRHKTLRHGHDCGVGRADLLRVLAALEGRAGTPTELGASLAQTLDFYVRPFVPATKAKLPESETQEVPDVAAKVEASPAVPLSLPPLPPPLPPLRAPMLGIAQVSTLAPPDAPPATPLPPLTAGQCQPREPGAPRFLPLSPGPQLARRLQATLAQQAAGRKLDLPHVVRQLACGQLPPRWQSLLWPYPPEHLTIIVDRSLHLRPYWDDQDQLVQVAHQWLGQNNLTTLTVAGDPWQTLACWSRGQEREPPPLSAPPAGCVVLVLSDMAQRNAGARVAGSAARPAKAVAPARWAQALRHLGRHGARVLVCAPASLGVHAGAGGLALWGTRASGLACAGQGLIIGTDIASGNTALAQLLTLLSCARRIEPELVRAMRRLVPALAAAPGLEAQLWACRAELAIGHDVCVWRGATAFPYRENFQTLPTHLQEAVLQTMLAVHAGCGRAIEMQEILLWASHVPPALAARYQSKIDAAQAWLSQLAFSGEGNGPGGQDEFIAFVQQTVAFNGADKNITGRFYAAFGPLWGIACQAAERNGQRLPDPGGLPAAMLPLFSKPPAGAALRRYQLLQKNGQLLLQAGLQGGGQGSDYAWSPMGMTLDLQALDITNARGQRRFSYPDAATVRLGAGLPKQALQVQTGTLALAVRDIAPPFEAAERGRDKYGLYADMAIPVAGTVIKQRFRYIEPGRFLMGSPPDELGRFDDEGPQHLVTITQGFWLAETTCTQALWQGLMGDNPSRFHEENKGGPAHPVERVSWDMIQPFLQKLEALLPGCRVTLPTEAEWEYACRAGTSTPFSFGKSISTNQVNYDGNYPYGDGKKGEYRAKTVAVKALPPNAWGLYQMHGNVGEWCEDTSRPYAEDAVTDPGLHGALAAVVDKEAARVLRGGGWSGRAQGARSAYRDHGGPDWLYVNAGFRLAVRSKSQSSGV